MELNDAFKHAIPWWRKFLRSAKPRAIDLCPKYEAPATVFTDGYCRQDMAAGGAIVYSVRFGDPRPRAFGAKVTEPMIQAWNRGDSDRYIGQAELPAPVVRTT